MKRKTPLTLVTPDATGMGPPRELHHHGRVLWDTIMSEFSIPDAGGLEMLLQICQAVDRQQILRVEIDRDGEVIRVRGMIKAHPALREELALRSFIVRTLQRLGLDAEPIKAIGRPATGFGWKGET